MRKASLGRLSAIFRILLAGIFSSSISFACSISFIPISVRPAFKVQVHAYTGPVKGLRLNLISDQGQTSSAVTDDKGMAAFSHVPLGTQYLSAEPDNGYGMQLKVTRYGSERIEMRWPSIEPLQVRSISGAMRAPDAIRGQMQQRVLSLDLLNASSGRVLASANTTDHGEFDFGRLAPGIYFIRLNSYAAFNSQVGGFISIAVDPGAKADNLDLSLTWTSCGLWYTDRSTTAQ